MEPWTALPHKVTADGPAYSQVQMVTPLARTVWWHYAPDRTPAAGRNAGNGPSHSSRSSLRWASNPVAGPLQMFASVLPKR